MLKLVLEPTTHEAGSPSANFARKPVLRRPRSPLAFHALELDLAKEMSDEGTESQWR